MRTSLLIHPDELSKKWIDRFADLKVTTLGLHPRGGRWAVSSLEDLLARLKTPEYRALLDYAADRGLEIAYEFHAAATLLPRDLFDRHPEYFRMDREGKRVPNWNFCVSNDEALGIVAERAAEIVRQLYRSGDRFHFWLDDGHDLACHCPECTGLSASDQQLVVLNAILRRIREDRPEARLAYLAYFDTLAVPSKVTPEPGIFLEYAPMEKYVAKGNDREERIAAEFRLIDPLLDFFGRKESRVLEYWYDNSMYSNWTKPPKSFTPDDEAVLKDAAFYREKGFRSIASFGCFLGPDYEELYGEPDFSAFGRVARA